MLIRTSLALAAAAAIASCGGSEGTTSDLPEEVALDVLIDDDAGVSIVAVYPIDEWRPLFGMGSVILGWQLRDGDQLVASGQVPDPRFVRSEGAGEIRVASGTVSLRLPSTAGDLVFLEGSTEIGRVAFDPSAVEPQMEEEEEAEPAAAGIGRTRSPLIRRGDVGRRERIFGDLPRRNGVDLLFLAEGYTERQLDQFRRDVSSIGRTFRSLMSRQRRYGGRFNIWLQSVRSRSSGIDDPRTDRRADTAFDITFGRGEDRRAVWFGTGQAEQAARRIGRRAGADVVVVLANSAESGGAAVNGMFVLTRHGDAPFTVAHELGHALLGLADEYDYGDCSHEGAPNVAYSTRRARIPWGNQIAFTTDLPTPENDLNLFTLGAFEGAHYCRTGAFRPQLHCIMQEFHRLYCRVCLGRLDRYLATLRRAGSGGGQPCPEDDPFCDDDGDDGDGGGSGACGDGTCAEEETDASCPADCGCAASDCAISPFGCFCDPECPANGDCCADACDACGSC